MLNLLDWLWTVPGCRLVPLFDAAKDLVVRTSRPERKYLADGLSGP